MLSLSFKLEPFAVLFSYKIVVSDKKQKTKQLSLLKRDNKMANGLSFKVYGIYSQQIYYPCLWLLDYEEEIILNKYWIYTLS